VIPILKPAARYTFLTTAIVLLLLSVPVFASTATTASAGTYCPGPEILLISAEELSTGLNLIIRSQNAFNNKDTETAISELNSAGTALHLAASRGSSARTNLILDTIIQAKQSEDYTQMLYWFPLLEKSMKTMKTDSTVNAANTLIAQTRNLLDGVKKGDPVKQLMLARHILACDKLDIPLQQAIQSQTQLLKQLYKKNLKPDYKSLLNYVNKSLLYTLSNS